MNVKFINETSKGDFRLLSARVSSLTFCLKKYVIVQSGTIIIATSLPLYIATN